MFYWDSILALDDSKAKYFVLLLGYRPLGVCAFSKYLSFTLFYSSTVQINLTKFRHLSSRSLFVLLGLDTCFLDDEQSEILRNGLF